MDEQKELSFLVKCECQDHKQPEKELSVDSLNTASLESNKRVKINFAGGDLFSDTGLLLIREFAAKQA